mgnify:CR=1 FL=1
MKLTPERADVVHRPQPDAVRMKGLLGARFDASRLNRLRHQASSPTWSPPGMSLTRSGCLNTCKHQARCGYLRGEQVVATMGGGL